MQRAYRIVNAMAIAMLALLFIPEAMAQTPGGGSGTVTGDPAVPNSWRWTLGLGAGIAPDYEGSEDYDVVPIPLARAQKGYRFGQLLGLKIESNLVNHPNWRIGPSANYRQGYNDVSDKRVDNLTDRGSSFELGLKGGYVFQFEQLFLPNPSLDFSLEFLHDVSSGHEGWVLTPSVTYSAALSDSWNMSLGGETTYASGNYMSHYFSVNASEAANSGLDNEDADADFKDLAVNLGLNYEITDNWGLNILGQYKRMLGDASDSPVVDDQGEDNQFFGGVVVSYSWGGK